MFEAIITFKVPIKSNTSMTKGDIFAHIDELKEKFSETAFSNNSIFGNPEIEIAFENLPNTRQLNFDFED